MSGRRIRWTAATAAVTASAVAASVALSGNGAALAARHTAAAPGTISTVAGGVGGPGVGREVVQRAAFGVSYSEGALYVAAGLVRKINPQTDWMTTPAGDGSDQGPLGDGGLATQASTGVSGVAVDGQGNLVLADEDYTRLRVVAASTGIFYGQAMRAGNIYTVAGNGTAGFSGDGGPATAAELSYPADVVVDADGNLLAADHGNDRIRVVAKTTGTFYGQAMTAGSIYTIAGDGHTGFNGDGLPATTANISTLGVALDGAGNVLIADAANGRIRVVAKTTGTFYGQAMTAGDMYTIAGNGGTRTRDGIPATQDGLYDPENMAVDGAGNVLIADLNHNRIRAVATSTGIFYGQTMTAGDMYTIAGTGRGRTLGLGGPATQSGIRAPGGVAVDGAGNVVITASSRRPVLVVASSTGTFYGQAMTAGHIYPVAGNGRSEYGIGVPATSAVLSSPQAVTAGQAGDVAIAEANRVMLVPGRSGTIYGRAVKAGHIYSIAGNGRAGFSGDGGPAQAAELDNPGDVAIDHAGNLLIADSLNSRLRVVAKITGTFYGQAMTAGDIYTVAGDGNAVFSGAGGPATAAGLVPEGVAVDAHGNLVIGDGFNTRVLVVAASTGTFYGQAMTAGDIYTAAGNGKAGISGNGRRATAVALDGPVGVAVDAAGNILIADSQSFRVRVVATKGGTYYGQKMRVGFIYTIAGTGHRGFSGDGGPATSAELGPDTAVAVDGAGNVLVNDEGNWRVRMVAAASGTFYGQTATAGSIYTVAGDGAAAYTGDGGPATAAGLVPSGVAVNRAGDLLIADRFNGRIREVTG